MTEQSNRRVLLIGWDGADWKVINALIDQGKMPNLEKLIDNGVMGDLATLNPPLSPMLWTSISTGKRPFKHGVLGFVEPGPNGEGVRPVGVLSRKTRALWNMMTLEGKRSNVVGWWPSHPAEPIDGAVVTNHYHRANAAADKPWPMRPGTVHPARLIKPLKELRVHPQELSPEQLLMFVPRAAEIDQEKDKRLSSLATIIAECATVHAAATALVQLEPWNFMGAYYDAIDHFSHAFMRYNPPRMDGVTEEDFELYSGVIEAAYRFHDAMLGVLIGLAGDDTTVVLVSDHGFHPDELRQTTIPTEPAGPAVQHRTHGIFVVSGPGIKTDERIYGASILDVAPTILSLYSLPVGEDMDGKALVNIFESPPAEIATIASWDEREGADGQHPPESGPDPLEATEMLQQLVDLGYVDAPDENKQKAAKDADAELRYNLARSYMHAHRHLDAAGCLEDLREAFTDDERFGTHLVHCYNALGRHAEARTVLEDTLARRQEVAGNAQADLKAWQEEHGETPPQDLREKERRELRKLRAKASINPATVAILRGMQSQAEGDHDTALTWFEKARSIQPKNKALAARLGHNRLAVKQWKEAETYFQEAVEHDPGDAAAHLGLARSLMPQRRHWEALDALLSAIALHYYNPPSHYLLGVVLHRLGKLPAAIEALSVCLAQNPNYAQAYDRLATIYRNRFDNEDEARRQEALAQEARERIRRIESGEAEATGVAVGRNPVASDLDRIDLQAPPLEGSLGDTAIIVSGLPRSGTSIMMQMLDAGGVPVLTDGKRAAKEGNPQGFYEYEPVKASARDVGWFKEARGKAVKVVAPLLMTLPRGGDIPRRVIVMERDLDEVVASQRRLLAVENRQGARMPDAVLRESLRNRLASAKRLLALQEIPTLVVNHAECIRDPASTAQAINAFLDRKSTRLNSSHYS